MVKAIIIPFMVYCLTSLQANAQNLQRGHRDSIQNKVYRAWIYTATSSKPITCLVWQTKDSTIVYSLGKPKKVNELQEMDVKNIKKVAFRGKNRVAKSALTGGIAGATVGALFGYSMGSDEDNGGLVYFTASDKAKFFGFLFTPIGIVSGLVAGTYREKIVLDGSPDTYNQKRKQIARYTLLKK